MFGALFAGLWMALNHKDISSLAEVLPFLWWWHIVWLVVRVIYHLMLTGAALTKDKPPKYFPFGLVNRIAATFVSIVFLVAVYALQDNLVVGAILYSLCLLEQAAISVCIFTLTIEKEKDTP